MKHFLIKYRFGNGSEEDWHREIKRFIAAIESDPALNGRISYRCLKANNGSGDCYQPRRCRGTTKRRRRRRIDGMARLTC
jgi:hypothetical protein